MNRFVLTTVASLAALAPAIPANVHAAETAYCSSGRALPGHLRPGGFCDAASSTSSLSTPVGGGGGRGCVSTVFGTSCFIGTIERNGRLLDAYRTPTIYQGRNVVVTFPHRP